MPLHPTAGDIILRLLLTIAAGALIGLNREASGHAAGLRTTIIVCLAASASMIQANILLEVGGKTPQSFAVMDVLRLPLGILTGVGFIGGGAILRRGDLVTGVTTAATMWVVTVIGLCFGGGQLWLGVVTTLIAAVTLSALKWVDEHLPHQRHATLTITAREVLSPEELKKKLAPLGCSLQLEQLRTYPEQQQTVMRCRVSWRSAEQRPPIDITGLQEIAGDVQSIEWMTARAGSGT
jgi:putative Mg2+ transporter-C (MgtC) family protein